MFFSKHAIHKDFDHEHHKLELTISDVHPDTAEVLSCHFAGLGNVQVLDGDLTTIKCDAWATAGNSFGDMGGGVDKAIDDCMKGKAQDTVRHAIATEYLGELPVGAAVVVRPHDRRPPLIYAPTMRIPGNIKGTINVYLAMRAILVVALRSHFHHVALPALGTGVGRLSPEEAGAQMRTAYDMVVGGLWKDVVSPIQAPYPHH